MKKILIFLGLITLSSQLLSIERDKKPTDSILEKKLSAFDKIKIAGSILGSGICGYTALLNSFTKEAEWDYFIKHAQNLPINLDNLKYIPSLITQRFMDKYDSLVDIKYQLNNDAQYHLTTAGLSILAFIFGSYAYKKLITPRKQKDIPNSISHKQKSKKWEAIKLISALFGCAFFATAALLNPQLKNLEEMNKLDNASLKHIPSKFAIFPFGLIYEFLPNQNQQDTWFHFGYNTSTAFSSIASYMLGSYAVSHIYEKLIDFRNQKKIEKS